MTAGQTAQCDGTLAPTENIRRAAQCATRTVPDLQADVALCRTTSEAIVDGLNKKIADRDAIIEAKRQPWHHTIGLIVTGALIGVAVMSTLKQGH